MVKLREISPSRSFTRLGLLLMADHGSDFLPALTRLGRRCYRCGVPLDGSFDVCPGCAEEPRPTIAARLLGFRRFRLRTLLILVAVAALVSGWVAHDRRRRLADDRGRFYSHEEWAELHAFLESATLKHAREAEQKAAAGGPKAERWAREAAELRAMSSEHAKAKREYQWRAGLKRSRW